MARPPKTTDQARRHRVIFRLDDAEMTALRSEGRAAGLSPHECARVKAIGGQAAANQNSRPAGPPPPEFFTLLNELRRVGVNLNQIARRFHMTGEPPPPELAAACRDLDTVFQQLLSNVAFE